MIEREEDMIEGFNRYKKGVREIAYEIDITNCIVGNILLKKREDGNIKSSRRPSLLSKRGKLVKKGVFLR